MACGSLKRHIDAAQKKEGTAYPVIEMDSRLHAEPKDMREALFAKMEQLPEDADTVLLAMGLCGGSVSERPLPVRLVMPRVDDCITPADAHRQYVASQSEGVRPSLLDRYR